MLPQAGNFHRGRASGQRVFGGFGMQRGNSYGRELGQTRQEQLS
jgi:hypothetical protein